MFGCIFYCSVMFLLLASRSSGFGNDAHCVCLTFLIENRHVATSYLLINRFSQPPPTSRHQIISIISIPSHLHNLPSSSIHDCIFDISVEVTSTHQWHSDQIPKTCARHQSSRKHNTVKILTLYPSGHAIATALMFPIN